MAVSPTMNCRTICRAFLATTLIATANAESKKEATRPAWTSTLQCLAPLAREARSGEAPLQFDQAFFDGPFSSPALPTDSTYFPLQWPSRSPANPTTAHLSAGFSYLAAFDDYRAAQHFREVLRSLPDQMEALIGLALINSDSARRYRCFLEKALSITETGSTSEAGRAWRDLLVRHSESGPLQSTPALFDEWGSLASDNENPCIAAALLRQATLFHLQGHPVDLVALDGQIGHLIPVEFPRYWVRQEERIRELHQGAIAPFYQSQPRLLQLARNTPTEEILTSEFKRLAEIQTLMPEATLNLGPTLNIFLNELQAAGEFEEVALLSTQLQSLPRDAHSPGTRYPRLARQNTPWVVGRRAEASLHFARQDWDALLHLQRGFSPADRAEYFAWQTVASTKTGADPNVWLAALRRERDSNDLVEQVENYLHSVTSPDESVEFEIPGLSQAQLLSKAPPISSTEAAVEKCNLLELWQPRPAIPFSLPDWQSDSVSLADWHGRPVVVIFFLGGGCLHCVEQLTAFAPWNAKFEEAGIDILAVSTDPVSILSETLRTTDNPDQDFPIPIVSDHELTTFRAWGVFDEFDNRALHATFLINEEGEIIWEEKGNTPYMHPDFLLYEASRLLNR